jgi:site-specific DNA recombinase
MKLIGYVRVSSKGQTDNTSIEEQKQRIAAYCEAHGHKLVKVYEETGSGKDTENRFEFQKAIETLRKADGIIAFKLDRIARNTADVLHLVNDVLKPSDKSLILLDLNVDTSTPTGMMILTVMAAVAQLERDQINERCRIGRNAKKEQGEFIGGRVPYGFDVMDGKLLPNPQEQAILETIRKHRRGGKTTYAIAKYLNETGEPTKTGAKWSHVLVGKLLARQKALPGGGNVHAE